MKANNFLGELISTFLITLATATIKILFPQLGDKMFIQFLWVIFIAWMLVFSIAKARKIIIKQKTEEIAGIKETFMSQANIINNRLDNFNKELRDLDNQMQHSTQSLNETVIGYKDATIAAIQKLNTERSG